MAEALFVQSVPGQAEAAARVACVTTESPEQDSEGSPEPFIAAFSPNPPLPTSKYSITLTLCKWLSNHLREW